MKNTAKCHCGALTVEAAGDPQHVFMCHCELCQRRTGSSYHLDAWFPAADVRIDGETKQYARTGDRGDRFICSFCPTCGSNVVFEMPEALPGLIGVAAGCFTDPAFPAPEMSLYERRRHRWLGIPESAQSFPEGVPAPKD